VKRSALIFFAAIFLPSLVLGWLALRTAGGQRVLIERQAADLHQAETDAIASTVRAAIEEKQRAFVEIIRTLVARHGASALAENYASRLSVAWPDGGIPFAISPQGMLAWPTTSAARQDRNQQEFLVNNGAFLSNKAEAEIYQTQQPFPAKEELKLRAAEPEAAPQASAAEFSELYANKDQAFLRQKTQSQNRNIIPQKNAPADKAAILSKVAPEFSDFQTAVGASAQGILARFVQDDLQLLYWTRPDPNANWLFGLMLGPAQFDRIAADILPEYSNPDTQLAVLNEKARPVARQPAGFSADWKRPFVATEIGEVLPHWEIALYLTNPGQLTESARLVTITLVLLIALALAAILAGSSFVAMDTRRQLALAQKKTDFVSNVSHELKTPLTSIRMFAELLADNRVKEPEKQNRYLRIIASESERLARLVNNVLDFARLEKNPKTYDLRQTDLHPVIERVWEAESLRLREAGFSADWNADPGPYPAHCDTDAIAQVLVNLISNAEKYSPDHKDIELRTHVADHTLQISILDRGIGVPRPLEEKIFEAFFRADDSLASGVQGSGLGLTLARRIARDHHGDLTCHPREGGGSIFTLQIPTTND